MGALTVCGPFRGVTGYDHHVREFVRELSRQGFSVWLRDLPMWSPRKLPFPMREHWFETLRAPRDSSVALHFCMPPQVRAISGLKNLNFTMFEANPAPPSWVEQNRTHDLLIVPTESSRAAWIAGGMPEERIRICPLGVNPRLFNGNAAPLPLLLANGDPVARYRVRFLNVSEIIPRKNLWGLLRTWIRATHADDDAVLILKLGYAEDEQLNAFRTQANTVRLPSGKALADAAPVHFLYDLYSDAEMPRVFGTATHYLSLSCGEGWDQPAMEAAACGLRLVVPRHSAYTAYLDESMASLISSREVPAVEASAFTLPPLRRADASTSSPSSAHGTTPNAAVPLPEGGSESELLFQGTRWWEPHEDEAAAFICAAIEGRDRATPETQQRIHRDFTWEQAAGRLIEILREVDPPRRRFWPFRNSPPVSGGVER